MSRDSKKIGGRGWVRRSAGRVAAITGRWRSGQDFPRWIALGGRFTAANLNPALARPGHMQSQATRCG